MDYCNDFRGTFMEFRNGMVKYVPPLLSHVCYSLTRSL